MRKPSMRLSCVLALGLAVGLAMAIAPFASPAPDGLVRVAQDEAFLDDGRLAPVQEDAPIANYALPGMGDARLATGLAGFAGTLAVFATGCGVAALTRRRRGPDMTSAAPTPRTTSGRPATRGARSTGSTRGPS